MILAEAMLGLELLSAPGVAQLPRQDGLLGGACFSHPAGSAEAGDLPLLAVDMALPSGEAAICEVWRSAHALQSGQQGAIRYRENDLLLFGSLSLDETSATTQSPLQSTTEAAYQAIFALLEARGFSALLRVWNYFPAINQESHGIERYRQFNIGRQDAFLAHDRSVIGNVPAACALGTASGGLHIAFLATRANVTSIENPRQLSAYHYPSQYGPRSPTFSRAGLVNLGGRDMLFISGTASIVGHQTLHDDDVEAQTRECLNNIAAITAEANRLAPTANFRLDQFAYKVYVRHPVDLAAVREAMAHYLNAPVAAVYLQADVCRANLLVEIEASGGHAIHVEAAA